MCRTSVQPWIEFSYHTGGSGGIYLNKNTVATHSESRTLILHYTGGKRWDIGLIHASKLYFKFIQSLDLGLPNSESNATKYEEDAFGFIFVDRVPCFLRMSRSFDNWSSCHYAMD